MSKNKRQISHPYLGYVFLLISFVMLGTLVAGLALASSTAAWIGGVGLVASLTLSVVGFRLGTLQLAKAREGGDPTHNISIWSEPLRQDAIDRYLASYRGQDAAAETTVRTLARGEDDERLVSAAPSRLTA
ncbi:hypothetical protein [[Mycobacterium] wendilense]|uniref:Uncharacterized protein n=1 Tax=[Mycobacterium] wendilense TaxID=3064284 RepID=A0ABN9P2C8_9MYCO|nr:hypothetical protein [Mycolicibacterium sp. MU0050]CAJ1582789.1 hypothetical protein MU0050_002281 [Mycolicibacterium sp. MU0050]